MLSRRLDFLVFCICLPALLPSVGQADLIWDESSQGDLSNFESAPTPVNLVLLNNDFRGTVGGSSNPNIGDGYDVFSFTIGATESLDSIIINDYQVAGGNLSTGFNIWQSDGTYLGGIAMDVSDIGGDVLILSGVGPLNPGDYYISLREFTAPGQIYDFSLNVSSSAIPEPRQFWILFQLVLFSLFGLLIRRRNRDVPTRT